MPSETRFRYSANVAAFTLAKHIRVTHKAKPMLTMQLFNFRLGIMARLLNSNLKLIRLASGPEVAARTWEPVRLRAPEQKEIPRRPAVAFPEVVARPAVRCRILRGAHARPHKAEKDKASKSAPA